MANSKQRLDDQTINVMHQIATLLQVVRDLQSMVPTFENRPGLDKGEADEPANAIIKFARVTSCEMLDALFRKESRRWNQVAEAQANALTNLPEAIEHARTLTKMERDAFA